MSHPSHVEYTGFHNRYPHQAKETARETTTHMWSDSLATSQRLCPGPLQGRWDNLRHGTGSPHLGAQRSPEKSHHLKHHGDKFGLNGCKHQRSHMFIDLPGNTFNAGSWERFIAKSPARSPSSPGVDASPLRRALSTTRSRSPEKIASRRLSVSRIRTRTAMTQPNSPHAAARAHSSLAMYPSSSSFDASSTP